MKTFKGPDWKVVSDDEVNETTPFLFLKKVSKRSIGLCFRVYSMMYLYEYHDIEDELFLVVKGSLLMKMGDKDVRVNEGEFIIIPYGVEDKPVAESECHIMLFEPKGTLNTGNVQDEKTVSELEQI